MNKNLSAQYLLDVVNNFYPNSISFELEQQQYIRTSEYLRLKAIIDKNRNKLNESDRNLKNKIEDFFNLSIENASVLEWYDRCLNWQMYFPEKQCDDEKTYVLCLNLSLIHDLFYIYVLEVEYDKKMNRLKHMPRRNEDIETTVFKDKIDFLKRIIEDNTNRKQIPNEILDVVIPNISFQEIPFGKFTYFNAFFINHYETRII